MQTENTTLADATYRSGRVKWFDDAKGYGFITGEDGRDVFVHYSEIRNEGYYRTLGEGEHVVFSVVQGPKGPQAQDVSTTGT
jgi:CspA family cold shock protein